VKHGIRLSVLGRRDRLSPALRAAVDRAEAQTRNGSSLHLRLAVDYSSRDAILHAAARSQAGAPISRESFSRLLNGHEGGQPVPDVDLLIRTGGERRLSDFLLWESAYAELVFTPRMWPDFDASDLGAAITEFLGRDRRFGRIEAAARGG
jgi:undecaprenyl diphosphate synthase